MLIIGEFRRNLCIIELWFFISLVCLLMAHGIECVDLFIGFLKCAWRFTIFNFTSAVFLVEYISDIRIRLRFRALKCFKRLYIECVFSLILIICLLKLLLQIIFCDIFDCYFIYSMLVGYSIAIIWIEWLIINIWKQVILSIIVLF